MKQQKAALGSNRDGAKSCQAQWQCHRPTWDVTSLSAQQEQGCLGATQGICPLHTMGYKNQPWEVETQVIPPSPNCPTGNLAPHPPTPMVPSHHQNFRKTNAGGMG